MFAAVILAVPGVLSPCLGLQATTPQCRVERPADIERDARVLAGFDRAVGEYASLHRLLAAGARDTGSIDDPEQAAAVTLALAAAIRAERADGAVGELFNPAVAAILRARIGSGAPRLHHRPTKVGPIDHTWPRTASITLHQPLPWGVGVRLGPDLRAALPELPAELEYRRTDHHLVLLDVDANIVVDLMLLTAPDEE